MIDEAEETVEAEETGETEETVAAEETVETAEVVEAKETVETTDEPKSLLADAEGDGEGDKTSVEVPETYEFVPPENFEVNDEVQAQLDSFTETAKTAGLTQDQYQKVVESEIGRRMGEAGEATEAYSARLGQWADATRTDKVLGGEDLAKNLGQAKAAIDKFGTPELAALFEAPTVQNPEGLGIGNHPEVIRLLHKVGGMLSEDELIGGQEFVEPTDGLKRMYPSMFPD